MRLAIGFKMMSSFAALLVAEGFAILPRSGLFPIKSPTFLLTSSTTDSSEEESIAAIYRQVAENDPEWFEEFVKDTLGEEAFEMDLGSLDFANSGNGKTEKPSHSSTIVEQINDRNSNVVESLSSVNIGVDEKSVVTDDISEVFPEEVSTLAPESLSSTSTENAGERDIIATSMDDVDTVAESVDVSSSETEAPKEKKEEVADIALSATLEETSRTELTVNPNANVKSVDNHDDTSKENTMESETVDELLNHAATREAPTESSSANEKIENNESSLREGSSDEFLIRDEGVSINMSSSLNETSLSNESPISSTMTNDRTQEQLRAERSPTSEVKAQGSKTLLSTLRTETESKMFVTYDGRDNLLPPIPLDSLTKLGYSRAEVFSLEVEALELIVEEAVRRPSAGIPSRWKASKAKNSISVVSESMYTKKPSRNDEKIKHKVGDDNSNQRSIGKVSDSLMPGPPTNDQRSLKTSSNEGIDQNQRRSQTGPIPRRKDGSRTRTAEDRRRKSRVGRNGEERTIYSGRTVRMSSSRKREGRGDPPSSSSGVWPDMNSFRGLLRREVRLRQQILGGGMNDSLRDESEWRLNVYRDWLWWIHDGIGEPMVESRSDRARRHKMQSQSQERR